MIFNSVEAERLYKLYTTSPSDALISGLHEISAGLIKAIALSLDRDFADDLIQEGHLKLHTIIIGRKYNPGRCSMYTFLSTALRNRMIDYLRKERTCLTLYDWSGVSVCTPPAVESLPAFDCYYTHRFPSISDNNPILYSRDALKECLNKSKIITTMHEVYGVPKSRAAVIYNSMVIFARYTSLVDCHECDFSEPLAHATNGHEFTLEPERILVGAPHANYTQIVRHVSIYYGRKTG